MLFDEIVGVVSREFDVCLLPFDLDRDHWCEFTCWFSTWSGLYELMLRIGSVDGGVGVVLIHDSASHSGLSFDVSSWS